MLRTLPKWRALVVCRRATILQAVLRDLLQYSRVAVVEADPGTVRRAADLYFDSKLRGEEANFDLIAALPLCLRTGHETGLRLGYDWRLGSLGVAYMKDMSAKLRNTACSTEPRSYTSRAFELERRAALFRLIAAMPRQVLRCAAADLQRLYEECLKVHLSVASGTCSDHAG